MTTPGFIGFKNATSHAVVACSGTWDAFPGLDQLGDGRWICVFNTGPNEVPGNTLVYKLSSDRITWGAQQTLYAPGGGITSLGAEVMVTSAGKVVVSTGDGAASPLGICYTFVGAVSGATGGTNNDGITWAAKVTAASGNPYGGSGVYSGPTKVFEYGASTWLHASYGGPSSFTGWGISKSTDKGATWGAVSIIIASNGVDAWSEVAWVLVPAGYSDAGDIIAILRRDYPLDNEGLYLTRCPSGSDPMVAGSWTTPAILPFTWPFQTQGRPTICFVKQGAHGGLFLLSRFNQTPKAGYTISWDAARAVWGPVKKFGGASLNTQFWYGSCPPISADGTIPAVISDGFNSQSTVARILARDFLATPPQ